jgi:5-methylcytosine-specific restriction endonuclease McrA
METKLCNKCGKHLPATTEYFCKEKRTKTGIASICISCKNDYNKNYRKQPHVIEKHRINQKIWASNNPEKAHALCKQWRQNNPVQVRKLKNNYCLKNREKESARAKRWYYANRERGKAYRKLHYNKEWNDAHRESIRSHVRNRRAKINGAVGKHTQDDIMRIYKNQSGLCKYCGKEVGNKFHVDHVNPISRGGSNFPDNLVISCQFCNDSKGNKLLSEWREGKFIHLLTNL